MNVKNDTKTLISTRLFAIEYEWNVKGLTGRHFLLRLFTSARIRTALFSYYNIDRTD